MIPIEIILDSQGLENALISVLSDKLLITENNSFLT